MVTGCPWDTFHLIICDIISYAVGCHLNMQLYFITKPDTKQPTKHRKKKVPNPQCEKNKISPSKSILCFFKLEILNSYSCTFTTTSWYYLNYKHIDSYHAATASVFWYFLPPISVRVWFTIWLAFTPEVFISRNIITTSTSLPENCWSLYGGSLKIDRKI